MTTLDSIAMYVGYITMGSTLIPLFLLLSFFSLVAAVVWTQEIFAAFKHQVKTHIERLKL